MNTNRLIKYLQQITPRERLALITQAYSRDDELAAVRLVESAPLKTWRRLDHFATSQALSQLANFHALNQLVLVARYFEALATFVRTNDAELESLLEWTMAVTLYQFHTAYLAWIVVCVDCDVPPHSLLEAVGVNESLERMPQDVLKRDELAERFPTWWRQSQPATVDECVTEYRDTFEKLEARWK